MTRRLGRGQVVGSQKMLWATSENWMRISVILSSSALPAVT